MIKALEMLRKLEESIDDKGKDLFTKLVEYVEEQILTEKIKETSSSKVYNTIKSILNRNKESRPILSKVLYKDNAMYFTDSYIAFRLVGKDIISGFPSPSDEKNYPNLDHILNRYYDCNNTSTFECEELKIKIKLMNPTRITVKNANTMEIPFGNRTAYVNSKLLSDVITILKFRNSDIITIETNITSKSSDEPLIRPLYIKNTEDSIAVIMPLVKKSWIRKDGKKYVFLIKLKEDNYYWSFLVSLLFISVFRIIRDLLEI